MKSILFGSIGVLTESSEIQRRAFNEAFKEFGLDWYWNVANYIKMLQKPGGLNRIADYSNYKLNKNDIKKIHDLKVKHFKFLSKNKLKPRKGILEVIDFGLKNHIKIAIVGKYVNLSESYKSLNEALFHSGISNNVKVNVDWIDSTKLKNLSLCEKFLYP